MAARKRTAKYIATLIYMDEPQVLALEAGRTTVVAVAIPHEDEDAAMFLATSVRPNHWEAYLDSSVDLRFLFTYPRNRSLYYFDLMSMTQDKAVAMTPLEADPPEEHLPLPRIFATDHTMEFKRPARASGSEVLVIDGDWEMPEFGQFYQKYSDVYAFTASTANYTRADRGHDLKARIKDTFRGKPFQGGSSYLHLFNGLNDNLPRDERTNLNRINYASPGEVHITGDDANFADVERLLKVYIEERPKIAKAYQELYRYLSKAKLLTLPGDNFPSSDPRAAHITALARGLYRAHDAQEEDTVYDLAEKNSLVFAKIVLSLSRRIEEAASFFAQGRMGFKN